MANLVDVIEQATRKDDKQSTQPDGDAKPSGSALANGDVEDQAKQESTPDGEAHSSPPMNLATPERRKRLQTDGLDFHMPHQNHQNHSRGASLDSASSPIFSRSPHDSPSSRTGPPRSFSYNLVRSPNLSRQNTRAPDDDIAEEVPDELGDEFNMDDEDGNGKAPAASGSGSEVRPSAAARLRSEFRGALEYIDPEQREREREAKQKREKNRLSKIADDARMTPFKWLTAEHTTHDSPQAEGEGWTSYFDFLKSGDKGKEKEVSDEEADGEAAPASPEDGNERHSRSKTQPSRSTSHDQVSGKFKLTGKRVERSQSMPHMKRLNSRKYSTSKGAPRWNRLRSLLPALAQQGRNEADPDARRGQMAVQPNVVNITDELITGGLAALMLKLWFERDERGNRRVPVLFHRLRVRISDSLHPLSGNKAVFRIECEYANGFARWVIYRQLRDFVSLHTHYRLSNAFNRNVDALPEFPKTSLPYFKFLREKGKENDREVKKADFARMQRESLENYLIGLIRAVMFHPTSNRMAGFLEISALSIALAQSGGWQAKAGMLTIESASKKSGGFGKKSSSWSAKRKQRWSALRESYLVAVEEPGEVNIWDVFMLDPDFKIERPKRYYRQGLNMLQHTQSKEHKAGTSRENGHADSEHGTIRKVKEKVERAFHFRVGSGRLHSRNSTGRHSTTVASIRRRHARSESGASANSRRSRSSSTSSSGSESGSDSPGTPMADPSTNVDPMQGDEHEYEHGDDQQPDVAEAEKQLQQRRSKGKKRTKDVSRHTFFVSNSQMRLKLFAKNDRQMQQWITAFEKTANSSHWTGRNRFDSFAPIRLNVAAQWLVDGRDYMWNLSRAILMARERIYIHDWWLSPELQMRRPNKEHYRLDKLLQRKAYEGVKIYIILYQEVSNRTTPTDSSYTKQRLAALHPNIMIQRSPSHFQTGTFYWAHHEKLCVIDEAIAFMGGIDLSFGRWDTPQHILIDTPGVDSEDPAQIWPGKDYSNARMSDFFTLNKPFEDMYDRERIPRMPWHDVGVQIVGQPARDLCRHFVQRWNYLLRIKNHTRTMPFLLPPPDFRLHDLNEQGLTGTCEVQICRSCGPWSMGTPTRVEHSIQNAYLKAIQLSDHFVYIENQFFITSTNVNDTPIENKIGDALVHRIIRAHREGTTWKCCIVIPLLPGFPYPVDHSDASAVRIILECQNRTICRGPNSIFSRLKKEGIDPDEYISVFCLRSWGKLPGNVLTSEMVYVHGKVCIVDDRFAIIGSANINERSQRGDRDSELAVIIRDTDMVDGTMAGKPYKVGRFAHTLRVRLMREHLGVDVDAMYEEDLMAINPEKDEVDLDAWDPDKEQRRGPDDGVTKAGKAHERTALNEAAGELKDSAEQALHGTEFGTEKDTGYYLRKVGIKSSGADATADDKYLEEERQDFSKDGKKGPGFASAIVPTLEEKTILEHRPPPEQSNGDRPSADANHDSKGDSEPHEARVHNGSRELFGAPADASKSPQSDDEVPHARGARGEPTDEEKAAVNARKSIRRHLEANIGTNPWTLLTPTPEVDPHGFEDPVCDAFWKNVWVACAVHNTEIFRKVFHCIPDDTVTTWKQYKEFVLHHERMNKPVKDTSEPVGRVPSETGDEDALGHEKDSKEAESNEKADDISRHDTLKAKGSVRTSASSSRTQNNRSQTPSNLGIKDSGTKDDIRRTPSRADRPFEKWERDEMEKLLGELRGHLVLYPTRFLEGEDVANNFLFNADRLLPMPIYD